VNTAEFSDECVRLCEQLIASEDALNRATLLQIAAATPEHQEYLLHIARQKTSTEPGDALRRAETAAALAALRGEGRFGAHAWRVAAQAQRVQGDHAHAELSFETAARCAMQDGDTHLAAQVQVGRIDSLGWLGRYDEAFALARRLESELRQLGDEIESARVLINLGGLYYRRDQYASALDCYERALAVFVQGGDAPTQAKLQANMANVLMELHRVEEAIALFEQARATFADHSMTTTAAMVDANVGYLHYLSGRHVLALSALQRARREFVQSGQTLETAKCDADMAEAYRELNLHPEALEAYQRAIGELETLGISYERARAELGRASVWMAAGQNENALAGLERASVLFQAHRNTTRQAHVRLLRAHLLRRADRVEEARQEAQQAHRTLSRRKLRGWAAEARFLIVELELEAGRNATRAMHHVIRAARAHARGWLECQAERALGRYHLLQGNTARGLRHLRRGVQALEQARSLISPEEMHVAFLRDKVAIYEEVVGTLLTRGRRRDILEALEYVERAKSRLLLGRVQAAVEGRELRERGSGGAEESIQNSDSAIQNLTPDAVFAERLEALRAELSRGYHRLNVLDNEEARRIGTAGAEDTQTLIALEKEYRALLNQQELARLADASDVLSPQSVISVADVQASLNIDETLLEYYIYGNTICAWIINANEVILRRDVACLDEVQYASRRLRYQLQRAVGTGELSHRHARRYQADAQEALRHLYNLLLRPLDDVLMTDHLIVVPHGELHGLPVHAFWDSEEQRHALDRWSIVYAPSAGVWYTGVQRTRVTQKRIMGARETIPGVARPALLMGLPAPGIEQVAHEVELLAGLLPHTRVLRGEEATRQAFHDHAPDCGLLHLAAHALYRADNGLFSGVQMADGWLLARDLYSMTLDCDLATLSACQTGMALVEAGDELFGLVRGFLAAGSRSVAASLWPADDRATAFLMERFYRHLLEGAGKSEALRAAQQQTREQFPHPYHWAAFVLVGER
jgi:CHAT domain-containing protein